MLAVRNCPHGRHARCCPCACLPGLLSKLLLRLLQSRHNLQAVQCEEPKRQARSRLTLVPLVVALQAVYELRYLAVLHPLRI